MYFKLEACMSSSIAGGKLAAFKRYRGYAVAGFSGAACVVALEAKSGICPAIAIAGKRRPQNASIVHESRGLFIVTKQN